MKLYDRYISDLCLVLEYQEPIIKKLIEKYKIEGSQVDETGMRYYITRFDQIRNSPRFAQFVAANYPNIKNIKDIFQFTFHELEVVVDQFQPKDQKKAPANDQTVEVKPKADFELVYQGNNLMIYRGNNQKGCVAINSGVAHRTDYTYCISRRDSSNLYNTYRNRGKTFYFVIDKDKPITDIFHVMVVHANSNGSFEVSTSQNTGDRPYTWEEIARVQPKIAAMKDSFVFVPFSDEEIDAQLVSGGISEDSFDKLSYERKKTVLGLNVSITYESFAKLPTELKNLWVNVTTKLFKNEPYITGRGDIEIKKLFANFPAYAKRLKARAIRGELVDVNSAAEKFIEPEDYPDVRKSIIDGTYQNPSTNVFEMVAEPQDVTSTMEMYQKLSTNNEHNNKLALDRVIDSGNSRELFRKYAMYIVHNVSLDNKDFIGLVSAYWMYLTEDEKREAFSESDIGVNVYTTVLFGRGTDDGIVNWAMKLDDIPTITATINKLPSVVKDEDTAYDVLNNHTDYRMFPDALLPLLWSKVLAKVLPIKNGTFFVRSGRRARSFIWGTPGLTFSLRGERNKDTTAVYSFTTTLPVEQLPLPLRKLYPKRNMRGTAAAERYTAIGRIDARINAISHKLEIPQAQPIDRNNQIEAFKAISKRDGESFFDLTAANALGNNPLRYGEKQILGNRPSFKFPYLAKEQILPQGMSNYLNSIVSAYRVAFDNIYIAPFKEENKWKYAITGRTRRNTPFVYVRDDGLSTDVGNTKVFTSAGPTTVRSLGSI